MQIELTKQDTDDLEYEAARLAESFGAIYTPETLIAEKVAGYLSEIRTRRKAIFLASPDNRALLEKLQTIDPAKLPDVAAAVDAAQKEATPGK